MVVYWFAASPSQPSTLLNNAGVIPVLRLELPVLRKRAMTLNCALLTKLLSPAFATYCRGADIGRLCYRFEPGLSQLGSKVRPLLIRHATSPTESCSTWTRYGQFKPANLFFTLELARRYPNTKSIIIYPRFFRNISLSPS